MQMTVVVICAVFLGRVVGGCLEMVEGLVNVGVFVFEGGVDETAGGKVDGSGRGVFGVREFVVFGVVGVG